MKTRRVLSRRNAKTASEICSKIYIFYNEHLSLIFYITVAFSVIGKASDEKETNGQDNSKPSDEVEVQKYQYASPGMEPKGQLKLEAGGKY